MEIVLTNIINPVTDKKCQLIKDAAIVIIAGKIIEIDLAFKIINKYRNEKCKIIDRSKFICLPSFFDMHFHWVQEDVRLMPKDSLLTWLANYTWPEESKYKSIDFTRLKAESFTKKLLKNGTLGGACYASIHPHSVDVAMESFYGDFIIGNVLMTMNSPKYLIQTKAQALKSVNQLSKKYKHRYAVTPRFAPTTSPDVMKKSAQIARKNKSFMQTHLSETPSEIDYVLSIYKEIKSFEKVKTYTEIYKKSKILGPTTIMGHGIYLNENELKILSKTKTKICHCPTSNAPINEQGLGSGLFNFKKIEKFKIEWALGSDIGGGPFLSMFDVMRSFVEQNKKVKISGATYIKALYHSTIAGAKILKLEKTNGRLGKGQFANFIFVDTVKISAKDNAESILKKIISKNKKNRNEYESMVRETVYKGKTLYSSISK